MTVLDASVVVSILVNEEPRAGLIRRRLAREDSFHAPHLLDIEVLSTLRRLVFRREIGEDQADLAQTLLPQLNIVRYPHLGLRERSWQLRHNMTPYDASYVALAEALDVPLVTVDGPLARAPGHQARIEYLAAP